MRQRIRFEKGFSLIELMIAIAIVGVLTLMAYPSYQGYVKQSNRQKAMADLMSLASAMESFKAQQYTYQGAGLSGANTGEPGIFNGWSPADAPKADRKYDLTIQAITDNGRGYELRATPASGGIMVGDGVLMYSSTGAKAWDSNNNGSFASSEYCWQCD